MAAILGIWREREREREVLVSVCTVLATARWKRLRKRAPGGGERIRVRRNARPCPSRSLTLASRLMSIVQRSPIPNPDQQRTPPPAPTRRSPPRLLQRRRRVATRALIRHSTICNLDRWMFVHTRTGQDPSRRRKGAERARHSPETSCLRRALLHGPGTPRRSGKVLGRKLGVEESCPRPAEGRVVAERVEKRKEREERRRGGEASSRVAGGGVKRSGADPLMVTLKTWLTSTLIRDKEHQ